MNTYLKVLTQHYADFKGRARRREYWIFSLVNALIVFVLQLPYALEVGTAAFDPFATTAVPALSALGWASLVASGVYALAVLIPGLAVLVRRLHDTGKSGWWALLVLLPLIGPLVLLIFSLLDSQPGSNRWGPNPKGVATPDF